MSKRTFRVEMSFTIEIEEDLIKSVLTDEWRKQFYDLQSPEDVASHLGFNLIQGRELTSLDGFADRSKTDAYIDASFDVDTIVEEPRRQSKPPGYDKRRKTR